MSKKELEIEDIEQLKDKILSWNNWISIEYPHRFLGLLALQQAFGKMGYFLLLRSKWKVLFLSLKDILKQTKNSTWISRHSQVGFLHSKA